MATRIYFYLLCLLCTTTSSFASGLKAQTTSSNIQRVRIDFTMPDGYVRHLLLAFTKDNAASDNYDYGYDAINRDAYPYDLNWMIGDLRCTTQGVGAFDDSKQYPLNMFMSNDGQVEISLDALENFDTPIDLFIYDSHLNTYTQINNSNYTDTIDKGDYLDRFYLVFKNNSDASSIFAKSLATDEITLEDTNISYLHSTKELHIDTNNNFTINNIQIYNLSGQKIFSLSHVNSNHIKVPLYSNQTKYGIVKVETNDGNLSSKLILLN
ncbi:hypothetical protein ACGK9U_13915 [Mariniflexile sp. HNIBRBA6329]|uniref:hypothetical protein n=1 Tax=Mariniflexile sp. HNIBRBA6329 TaxID=3373088 RepID=UPI003744CB2C